MPQVGSELPPHLKRKRSSDEEEEAASSPPIKIQAATPKDEPQQRRVMGPSLPPARVDERPSEPANDSSDSSSDDDDDYGPALPSGTGASGSFYEADAQEEVGAMDARKGKVEQPKLQREEWMLVPPKDSDWTARVDPTKLKNRKFQSGKGAKAPPERTAVSAIWTETPEQRRKRLEDEVMGRTGPSKAPSVSSKPRKDKSEGEQTARKITEYNEKYRTRSLYEEHNKGRSTEEDDDPSKRAFDKEKDMAVGGRLGYGQKKEMLKRASDFGSRFERGSYL